MIGLDIPAPKPISVTISFACTGKQGGLVSSAVQADSNQGSLPNSGLRSQPPELLAPAKVPPHSMSIMGRTFALLRMSMQGTNPLGGIVAGAALTVVSVPFMIGLSAVFVALPGVFGFKVNDLRSAR